MYIYKYPLQLTDTQVIMMPRRAEILDVQVQKGQIQLWAMVDVEEPLTPRTFHIIGTGNKFTKKGRRYISTIQDGAFVWHIFEVL